MTNTLRTIVLAAGLAIAPAALAQSGSSSDFTHSVQVNGESALLKVVDGKATLTVNGEPVALPPADTDWTRHEVTGEDGSVLCVVTRSDDGKRYQLEFGGAPTPMPIIAQSVPRGAIAPGAPVPGIAIAPAVPGMPAVVAPPRVMLGVRLDTAVDADLKELGLGETRATRINYLMPGAPAQAAGLAVGDLIVGIGGRKGGTIDDIRASLDGLEAGDHVVVRIVREGEIIEKRVELAPFDEELVAGNITIRQTNRGEMDERLAELDAALADLKAAISETQRQITRSTDAEDLRKAAAQMQRLAERTATLNRERAEVVAKQAAEMAERFELDAERMRAQELNGQLPRGVVRLPRQGEDGTALRLLLEGQGEPVIIERGLRFPEGQAMRLLEGLQGLEGLDSLEGLLNLQQGLLGLQDEEVVEQRVAEIIEKMVEGQMGDEFGVNIRRFMEMGEELGERVEFEVDTVVEDMDDRLKEIENDIDTRLRAMESRLERIEEMLRRLD